MSLRLRLRGLAVLGARFLTVGAISTVIEIVVFNLLFAMLGWDVVGAKITASLVALINAYFGNRQWTFRHRDRRRRSVEVSLFLLVNAICTALGAVVVWLGVDIAAQLMGRTPGTLAVNVVNLVSIVIVVVARFGFYHGLVFRTAAAKTVTPADDHLTPRR